jgi:hypothetical protein
MNQLSNFSIEQLSDLIIEPLHAGTAFSNLAQTTRVDQYPMANA